VIAGRRDVRDLVTLARGLGDEVEVATWSTLATAFDYLSRAATSDDRHVVASTIRELFGSKLEQVGWEPVDGEDERTPTLRGLLIQSLGTVGEDPAVRREALERFDAGAVEGDLASAVLATVGASNRAGDFDEVFGRFKAASEPQAENRFRRALTQFDDTALTLRCFDMCFSEFRLQDVPLQMVSLLANRTGGPAAWEQLSERWDEITAKIPSKSLYRLVGSMVTFISDRAFAERVAAFHTEHRVESGQRQIDQSVERMLTGVAFAERVRPGLATQLAG
jgi:hypothetical protein